MNSFKIIIFVTAFIQLLTFCDSLNIKTTTASTTASTITTTIAQANTTESRLERRLSPSPDDQDSDEDHENGLVRPRRRPLIYRSPSTNKNPIKKVEPGTFSQFFREKEQRLATLLNATAAHKKTLLKPTQKFDRTGKDHLEEEELEADLREKLSSIYELDEEDLELKKREKTLLYKKPDYLKETYGISEDKDDPFHHTPSYYSENYYGHYQKKKPVKHVQYSIDPAHPALQNYVRHNPLAPFTPEYDEADTLATKKKKYELTTTLLPLDKTILLIGIAFGWLFWFCILIGYHYLGGKQYAETVLEKTGYNIDYQALADILNQVNLNKFETLSHNRRPFMLKMEPGKPAQYIPA